MLSVRLMNSLRSEYGERNIENYRREDGQIVKCKADG